MLGAIMAAASAVKGVGEVVGSLADGFGKVSDKDKARINAAQSALTKALNGDASALAYMVQQSNNSATDVGKEAFRRALQQYYTQKTSSTPVAYTAPSYSPSSSSSSTSPLQDAVQQTVSNVRNDLAQGVQNIGAGATSAAASGIAARGSAQASALTIPTNPKQLLILGGAALGAFLILKKH